MLICSVMPHPKIIFLEKKKERKNEKIINDFDDSRTLSIFSFFLFNVNTYIFGLFGNTFWMYHYIIS